MKFAPAKALFLLLTTFSVLGTSAGSRQEAGTPVQAQGTAATAPPTAPIQTVPGMPPVPDPKNIYSETTPNHRSSAVKEHLERIYVPNLRSKSVSVIDPHTMKVVDTLRVEKGPQHVVPSWDLSTLWVANNAERSTEGSLTPIDPRTAQAGKSVPVDDPYNVYFTPDGASLIVVAEERRRLDFRDPKTLAMQYSISTPQCGGINHGDFSIDGRFALFTCEFDGSVAKIDLANRKVLGYLKLKMPAVRFSESKAALNPLETEICTSTKGMPQDIRISPDGKRFFVADMDADGVHVLDGDAFVEVGFIPTGLGAHGLYPSRDGKRLYVANRGTHKIHGK